MINCDLEPEEFLKQAVTNVILDVRTPDEFEAGHIAGAINFPLFTNDERAIVGKVYKNSGHFDAVKMGYRFVGPRMEEMLKQATQIIRNKDVLVYCWRGGLRSESIVWLLSSAGFRTTRLKGGYKAYRSYGKNLFSKAENLVIMGGKTGSGKTELLHALAATGEQVVDLEGLAYHKGSSFGNIGMPEQTANEHFENRLIEQFRKFDLNKRIWIEDESKSIGKNYIPDELWQNMLVSKVIFIETDEKSRLNRLVKDYSTTDISVLKSAFNRIAEKIGNNNLKEALFAIENNNYELAASIALYYYDKAYLHSLEKHPPENVVKIDLESDNIQQNISHILQTVEKFENIS